MNWFFEYVFPIIFILFFVFFILSFIAIFVFNIAIFKKVFGFFSSFDKQFNSVMAKASSSKIKKLHL